MEIQSLKQLEEWVTNLWNKYCTDIFFRTTTHIVLLQIILTAIVILGLRLILFYLTANTREPIEHLWPALAILAAIILSFGFLMVYIALSPTRKSFERKKRFVSNISHEIRTPLAIMRTNTDVALLQKETPEKIRDMLKRNIQEFDRISDVMNNLLSLSNLVRDTRIRFDDIDLSVLARRAIEALKTSSTEKNISVTFSSDTDQLVRGNARALEQIVQNLLKNAITHSRPSGHIAVAIADAADGKYVHLSVTDSGSGIAREDLLHIFEPFYRSQNIIHQGGHGLGLAIVQQTIQMHRGKIKIQSALGRGTSVRISLHRSSKGRAYTEPNDSSTMAEVSYDFSRTLFS